MKEYIEREAAKNAIYEYILNQKVSMYSTSEICKAAKSGAEGAMYEIEYVPAADVVERVRGEWIYSPTSETVSGTDATMNEMCSVCGERAVEDSNFCPNCGADMRGEEHER